MRVTEDGGERVEAGDLAALERLYRRHHDHLVRLAMVMTGDAALADDLAQEAFIRLGRSSRWPGAGAELAYLRRTVVNLAHGHHRRVALGRKHVLSAVTVPADPAADAVQDEQRRRIADAVRRLPRRQLECVVLRFYAQLSEAEIADMLEVSAGSVKTHLHRARAALAESLEELR